MLVFNVFFIYLIRVYICLIFIEKFSVNRKERKVIKTQRKTSKFFTQRSFFASQAANN